ncbi:MAG: amino acid-binding protein [Coriobacteriia bacterium]|nr:amino acid-binding protein [Coriobacteriia bacterium]MCL2870676.1 amino acid-binding protein [Coriobacteriia bacterium]
MAQQLSVFLEDAPGRLNQLTRVLGDRKINMHALFLSKEGDFGVVRIICDKTEHALIVLKKAGFSVATTDIVAVAIPDTPGALGKLFEVIANADIDISYAYCIVDPASKQAVNFCRFKTPHAAEIITSAGFTVLGDSVFHENNDK